MDRPHSVWSILLLLCTNNRSGFSFPLYLCSSDWSLAYLRVSIDRACIRSIIGHLQPWSVPVVGRRPSVFGRPDSLFVRSVRPSYVRNERVEYVPTYVRTFPSFVDSFVHSIFHPTSPSIPKPKSQRKNSIRKRILNL